MQPSNLCLQRINIIRLHKNCHFSLFHPRVEGLTSFLPHLPGAISFHPCVQGTDKESKDRKFFVLFSPLRAGGLTLVDTARERASSSHPCVQGADLMNWSASQPAHFSPSRARD